MPDRRTVLSHAARVMALLAAAGVLPVRANPAGYPTAAFEADTLPKAWDALGRGPPTESAEVTLTGPDIAEDGALVPIDVAATLPGVRRLMVLIEKNPAVLSALFEFGDSVPPKVSLRVKMAESCDVYAVAETAEGRWLFARKGIRVIQGGCG
jgi:sulfur-oxidizing protein SoxY